MEIFSGDSGATDKSGGLDTKGGIGSEGDCEGNLGRERLDN